MKTILCKDQTGLGLKREEICKALEQSLQGRKGQLKKVLILPPDITRIHSKAGEITAIYYELLKDFCQVDIMPALGTHMPMTHEERIVMFGNNIPDECFIDHDWKNGIQKIGEVPGEFVDEVSEGLLDYSIEVEVNRILLDPSYDLILSVGQVVPHEVVGMANYSKNIFVGCGGQSMINKTHFLGAVYGMERMMGRDHSPVRRVFDYAETHFSAEMPLLYVLTVTSCVEYKMIMNGLFIGRDRSAFEDAVEMSREMNLDFLEKPLTKVVVYLDPEEFKSTWLGNKAIYRTRMAIADSGELLILAPGVRQFGEDGSIDKLIRKYGYVGRERILQLVKENIDLQRCLSAAAHLMHGSSDGRFSITYAVEKLSQEEVESVNFDYLPLDVAMHKYNPAKMKDGLNIMPDGEQVFFVRNPALGLWVSR